MKSRLVNDIVNVWGYKFTIFGKILCLKSFLHDKLHTFLFDNIRYGNFSNTASLALAHNYALKMGNSRIDQVRHQLLQLESRWQVKSRHLLF